MTTQHTPGPWFYDAETGSISSESREWKAEIASLCTGYLEPFESEQQANLRLILAAPELIEALERLVRQHGSGGIEYSGDHPIALARAAIAKATRVTK